MQQLMLFSFSYMRVCSSNHDSLTLSHLRMRHLTHVLQLLVGLLDRCLCCVCAVRRDLVGQEGRSNRESTGWLMMADDEPAAVLLYNGL